MKTFKPLLHPVNSGVFISRNRCSGNIIFKRCLLLCVLFAVIIYRVQGQDISIALQFTTDKKSNCSGGIFRKDSSLIRTLWNNKTYEAGTHTVYWDRKDNDGNFIYDTGLVFRVVCSNVRYEWEGGVIGNTSDSMTGSSKHRYFERPNSMSISGQTAYFSAGYSEGISSAYKLNLKSVQNRSSILSKYGDIDQNTIFTATDGKMVYWAGFDPFNRSVSFVYASSVTGDKEITFKEGKSVKMTYGRTYPSAIDLIEGNILATPSGMAVQTKGKFLFISHNLLNEIHVLDKSSGQLIKIIQINQPRYLCVDALDNLWIISGSKKLERHGVNPDGTLTSVQVSINNLQEPLAMGVSPNNHLIVVSDGGNSQQIKAFANGNGKQIWVLGKTGGYKTDPAIETDKFYFRDSSTDILTGSFIAFQNDSSFWFGDPGNERILHFDASLNFIEQIMSMPKTYSIRVDPNNPERVFNDFLEFRVDYSKPLSARNGSWTAVKNWRAGVAPQYFGSYQVLRNVITLKNGRTYAFLENKSSEIYELVELPVSGHLRFTGITFDYYTDFIIDNEGNFRGLKSGNLNDPLQWYIRELTGFDNLNNPQWGNPVILASVQSEGLRDPKPNGQALPAYCSSGRLISFCPRKIDAYGLRDGYHLGAVKVNDNKWLWKSSFSTKTDYTGPMPADGSFDIGNGVEYPAGNVYAIERNIFWNYHGEFWKNSQTNIWNHYSDNGLMIAQFGITTPDGEYISREAFPMGAGNVFSSALIKIGNVYYLYHNDESVHGAVHRWKISGLETIRELSYPVVNKKPDGNGVLLSVFKGKDLNNARLITCGVVDNYTLATAPEEIEDSNDYSLRLSSLFIPDTGFTSAFNIKTKHGIRLWLNDSLIIDKSENNVFSEFNSNNFLFEKGHYYKLTLETLGSGFELKWLNGIPVKLKKNTLFTGKIDTDNTWLNLLDNLPYHRELINSRYGWFRTPATDYGSSNTLTGWDTKTNIKTTDKDKRDLNIIFSDTVGNALIRRELGDIQECNTSWELRGTINLQGNTPNIDGHGMIFRIKDQNGLTICQFTNETVPGINGNENNVRIMLNGDDAMNRPASKMYKAQNSHAGFTLKAEPSGIYFQFMDQLIMKTTVYNQAADWNRPYSIEISFEGSPENYRREINISHLEFKADRIPVLYYSNAGAPCEGSGLTLSSGSAQSYIWSNGETSASIKPAVSGIYHVTTASNNCLLQSASRKIVIHPLPEVQISQSGDTLFSNYTYGNTWLLNGNILAGENKNWLIANSNGIYSLVVNDSNGCSGKSADFEFQNSVKENNLLLSSVRVHPNPNNGMFILENLPDNCTEIRIINSGGICVYESLCAGREIEIDQFSSGLYFIILSSGDSIIKQVFSIVK